MKKVRWRWFVLLLVAVACGDGPTGADVTLDADPGPFGGHSLSPEELARSPKALPREALRSPDEGAARTPQALPSVVKLSNLPPPKPQGTREKPGAPGSCEVWSAGYAMGSYAANVVNQQPSLADDDTVSAAYVYADVLSVAHEACPSGTDPGDTLSYLVRVGDAGQGAPTLAQVHYEPKCSYLSGIELGRTFDTDLSIGSYSRYGASSALETIKSTLAGGLMAQMTLQVPYDFPDYEGGIYTASTTCPTPGAGVRGCTTAKSGTFTCIPDEKTSSGCAQHGVAFIGYDDATQALWIQNSFGSSWGEGGLMWMSYDTFEQVFLAGTIAEPPPAPTALAPAVRGHQWRETRATEPDGVHLVLPVTLARPVLLGEVRVTPAGSEQTVVQDYGQWFRAGTVHFTRRDGHPFPAGTYDVELRGSYADGTPFSFADRIEIGALPGSDADAAPIADGTLGTNGLPARLEPAGG